MLMNLIDFLQYELLIPSQSIVLALHHSSENFISLPMILWQYGLITLQQLDLVFDWLERNDLGDMVSESAID